jgi:hypothetical protein
MSALWEQLLFQEQNAARFAPEITTENQRTVMAIIPV